MMAPLGQNTAEDLLRNGVEPVEADPRIAQCKERGGTWNKETLVCDFSFQQRVEQNIERNKPEPEPEIKPLTKVPRDAQGNLPDRTITDRQGNERIQTLEETKRLQGETEFEQSLGGGLSAEQAIQQQQAQAAEQQRIGELVSTIGRIGGLSAAQEADINFSQALTAGTVGSLPSILASVGAGITGGALAGAAGGPIGVVGGAAIGLIAGIARGILGNIKEQQRGELQAADIELSNARTNMRQLAMLASQDPQNADVYIAQYNQQLTRIHQARRQTKAEVSGDLNAFMEDGREQLADFDAFLQTGGIADVYGQKLQIALQTGAPLDISGEEFLP